MDLCVRASDAVEAHKKKHLRFVHVFAQEFTITIATNLLKVFISLMKLSHWIIAICVKREILIIFVGTNTQTKRKNKSFEFAS